MSKSVSVGARPNIRVESVGGDLSVVGWEGNELLIKGEDDDIRSEQTKEVVSVSSDSDLSLRVPRGASLELAMVGGDASIRGISGHVELGSIGGDLSIRDVNSVSINSVVSDFGLRTSKGNLAVKNVGGDVSIRDVDGNVDLVSIADDLTLRDVRGNVHANVGGDVVLYLNPRSDQTYNVTAGDDILLVLPFDVNATLTMNADEISMEWPGVEEDAAATTRVVTLGNGAAQINLKAGSDIRVSSDLGAGESADEFGNFAGMMFDWSDFGQNLGERISRRVESATRRATQKAERATRRVEQKLNARGKVGFGRWNIEPGTFPASPRPPMPPSDPVSEQERMSILKMLQENKITAQQAEELLAALEGGE